MKNVQNTGGFHRKGLKDLENGMNECIHKKNIVAGQK